MSVPSLDRQRVVVTGAAQGLGAAIARAFAAKGADLVLIDRLPMDGIAAETGGLAIRADLADADDTRAAIARILEGAPVDTLVHNAGVLKPEPFGAVTFDTFRATVDVGLQAGYLLAQGVWPAMMERGGALIFVSSQSGIRGFAAETAYCASKHALEGLSKCLALEGGVYGIVSCTITPGKAMHTPMSEENYSQELKAEWIDPARLAPAFLHIAETRFPAMSGQRLNAWEIAERLAS